MKPSRSLVCSIIAAACVSAPALAALGGDASSVESDRMSLRGTVQVTQAAAYAVHEIQTSAGLVVHEYLTPDGKVFAVSWHGPRVPDLQQLLGTYYGTVAQASSVPHRDHNHLLVQTPDLVVQSRGHLRTFTGRAWAPALLPQNFSVDTIN
jgi:hypothetical protein